MKVTAWTVKIHPSTVKQNNGQTLSQVDQTLACAPKINVATMLNIVPSTALNSDTVKVNWSQELGAPASCVNITGTNIQVKTIHVDNNFICSGSHVASAGANQDTVKASCNPEPIGNPGGVNRIETTLSPLLTAGSVNLSASKSGNF
jgi:hypothetical protein